MNEKRMEWELQPTFILQQDGTSLRHLGTAYSFVGF